MRWPGKIPAGTTCDELASTMDILPTIASLIGAKLPDHEIDGHNIQNLMFGEKDAKSPYDYFYHYYAGGQLQAVRDRQWKLHFPHQYRTLAGRPGGTGGIPTDYQQARTGTELYDLKADISEQNNVADEHPEIVQRLSMAAEIARKKFGDKLTSNAKGDSVRPAGHLTATDARLPLIDK
jgi:arylsulfatase A-like enzyme